MNDPRAWWRAMWGEVREGRPGQRRPLPPEHPGELRAWQLAHWVLHMRKRKNRVIPSRPLRLP
jgi:hypothetical protein